MSAKPLGAYVAVEPLLRDRSGSLHLPWMRQTDDTYAAFVLAIGDDVGLRPDGTRARVPFGVGDVVLCESMCGHLHMAGEEPPRRGPSGNMIAGKTRPVDLRGSVFGGSPEMSAALIPYYPDSLPPCDRDEEAERRKNAILGIQAWLKARPKTIEEGRDEVRHLEELMGRHMLWMKRHEAYREGRHRTKVFKRTFDAAGGDGILAVFESIDDVVAYGVDAGHLLRLITTHKDSVA